MTKTFKELVPGDLVWLLELEDESSIKNEAPVKCEVTNELYYDEDFEYNAILMEVPRFGASYQCVVDDSETTLALTDPYWIVATSEEEIMKVFNNPEKYGFNK